MRFDHCPILRLFIPIGFSSSPAGGKFGFSLPNISCVAGDVFSSTALLNLWVATPFGVAEVKIGVAEKLVFEAPISVFFWSRAMKNFS